jgi:LysR family glycine cleavage system transcriptional activator
MLLNPWTPWARWFRAAGLDWPEPASGPKFDDAPLLLRAALDGQGIALGRQWLFVDEVRAKRLVTPFELAVRDDFSYWLVWPTGRNPSPEVTHFRDWLAERAAAEEAPCPINVVGA